MAVTVGLLCLVAWAVRLGFVADLLSRPVLIGYLAGVALIMIVDQLPKLTGVSTTGSAFFPQLWSFLRHLHQLHVPTLVFAAVTLAFLFAVARLSRMVPGPLLAVVLGTAAVAALDLDDRYGIKVIGHVPAGLPTIGLPDLTELPHLVLPALGVLLVAYTDFILTARAFTGGDEDDGPGLDADQEFLALGAANLGAGVLHGFPVSSSASRTALASSAGARSQTYSLIAGAVVLSVLLFLSPLLSRTPSAVLGALVVYAAVRMIDLTGFHRLATFRRRELLLALGCLAGVLALDILYGVIVAVGLSVAELLTRVARPHDAVEGLVPGVAGDARRGRLPAGPHDPRPAGLPLRLTPLLRQRGELPPPRAGRCSPTGRPCPLVRPQRRGQRGGGHHRPGRGRRTPPRTRPPGRRVRPRPGQTGPPGRPGGVRPGGLGRHRPHLPDLAYGCGGVSGVERCA